MSLGVPLLITVMAMGGSLLITVMWHWVEQWNLTDVITISVCLFISLDHLVLLET